jgi:hypothetical protein
MKRLTPFQEAQLVYAYRQYNRSLQMGIYLKASNGVRHYRDGFWDKVANAFIEAGVAQRIKEEHYSYTTLIPEKAKAYIEKYGCTDDMLYLEKQPLTPFDKAQLRHLYEHNHFATYRTGGWGRGCTYPRVKETLTRLYHHGFISSTWFGSWYNLGEGTLTDAGRDYVEQHDISLAPLS